MNPMTDKFNKDFYRKRSEQFEKKVDDLWTRNQQLEKDKTELSKMCDTWEALHNELVTKNNKLIEQNNELQNLINKLVDKL